ncbi:MAG: hypothetical protein JW861_07665 [Bacteroidales bacterium]|nr:hypothetical protein [Bacteroidales bacterium]
MEAISLNQQFRRETLRDIILLMGLFFISIVVMYFTPKTMGAVFIFILMFLFLASRKDYFWLAYLFVVICRPNNLFYAPGAEGRYMTFDPNMTGAFPEIDIGIGISISSLELFLILAVFKALARRKSMPFNFKRPMVLLFFYGMFLVILSFTLFNGDPIRILKDVRYMLIFFAIIPFSSLITKPEEGYKFVYLILPFGFFIFLGQLFYYVTGEYLTNFLAGTQIIGNIEYSNIEDRLSMLGGEQFLLFFIYVFSVFMLYRNLSAKDGGPSYYFIIIAMLSFLSIFATATRVWFVAFVFFIVVTLVIKRNFKMVTLIAGALLLFGAIYLLFPQLGEGYSRSYERIATLAGVGEEDNVYQERYTLLAAKDLPPMIRGIRKNPFFGYGFSEEYYLHANADVGNINFIYQGGFIGFGLLLYLISMFYRLSKRVNRALLPENPFKKTLMLLFVGLMTLSVPHFTTTQVFAFNMPHSASISIAAFLSISSFFLDEALRVNAAMKNTAGKREEHPLPHVA